MCLWLIFPDNHTLYHQHVFMVRTWYNFMYDPFLQLQMFVHDQYASMDSSEMIGSFPKTLNCNKLFFKLNWFVYKQWSVPPFHCIECEKLEWVTITIH